MGSSFGIISQTGNNIQTEGLIFYVDPAYKKSYPGTGTTTFNLASGSLTPNGSLVNDTGFVGLPTSRFTFDGVNDYINITTLSNGVTGDNPFTIGGWAFNTDTTLRNSIFSYGTTSDNRARSLEVGTPYSGTRYNISFATWGHIYSSNNDAFTENAWHYCVITYAGGGTNSTNIKFYIDGLDAGYELDHGSENQTLNTSNNDYRIGIRFDDNVDFNGNIGPVHLYNRALSASDVLQNYQAQKGRFGL